MSAVPDDVEPLLAKLMEHLERTNGFEEAVGLAHARLASFCSRRRERLQVKAPPRLPGTTPPASLLPGGPHDARSLSATRLACSDRAMPSTSASSRLDLALWIAQGVFALAFGAIGVLKFVSWRSYIAAMPVPVAVVFALGIVEVVGALGLVAPVLSRSLAWLPPVAAIVLAATAVLALVVHAVRAEWSLVPVNVVLVAGAAFIAWGRWPR